MRILISVTNAAEALAALSGEADIIDVKNPREGSLGASTPHVIRQIRQSIPDSCELSATVGDAPYLPGTISLAALGAATCGVNYVKIGLFGTRTRDEAIHLLRQANRSVKDWNPAVRVIGAGYADAHKIGAILPRDVPDAAAAAGVDGCMLDTARKGEEGLLSLLSLDELRDFVAASHKAGLLCALAGALRASDLPALQAVGADIVGFRSAACSGDRIGGQIDSQKVQALRALITPPTRAFLASSPGQEVLPAGPVDGH